jgi:hypothetical protein
MSQQFDGVFNLLIKIFSDSKSFEPKELALKPIEKNLFVHLMQRKFNLNLNASTGSFASLDVGDLTELILAATDKKSNKRIEERKKFVFKQIIKLIKQKFCGTSKIRSHPSNSGLFYQHDFGDLVTSNDNITLEMFYDPLNPKLKNPVFKTLSNEYISLIFKSADFKVHFIAEMDPETFILNYRSGLSNKLQVLLDRWEQLVQKNVPADELAKEMTKYFRENRQCKFPWTVREIRHSLQSFGKFVPKTFN